MAYLIVSALSALVGAAAGAYLYRRFAAKATAALTVLK